LKSNWLFL